jgi:hypothetical protein
MGMMQVFDPVCLDAFARLLARPDPKDLPRRTHIPRCEGDPDRRATRLPGILMGWLQRRHLEIDMEEPGRFGSEGVDASQAAAESALPHDELSRQRAMVCIRVHTVFARGPANLL